MRTARKIKQRMFYSLPTTETPVYERDSEGNIIYESYTDMQGNVIYILDDNGNKIPIMTGNVVQGYSEPVEFLNGISGRLSEALIASFGIDDSSMYAQMEYIKGQYPFVEGTLIWKKSEVQYIDGKIDKTSADYEIVGILDEYPNVWSCLLKRLMEDG